MCRCHATEMSGTARYAAYVRKEHIIQYGATQGCGGCYNLINGLTRMMHSSGCKDRFAGIIGQSGRIRSAAPDADEDAGDEADKDAADKEDAPPGSNAYTAVAFVQVAKFQEPLYTFKWRDKGGKKTSTSFEVNVNACGGNKTEAARIARLCYARLEEGKSMADVERLRDELCLQSSSRSGAKAPASRELPTTQRLVTPSSAPSTKASVASSSSSSASATASTTESAIQHSMQRLKSKIAFEARVHGLLTAMGGTSKDNKDKKTWEGKVDSIRHLVLVGHIDTEDLEPSEVESVLLAVQKRISVEEWLAREATAQKILREVESAGPTRANITRVQYAGRTLQDLGSSGASALMRAASRTSAGGGLTVQEAITRLRDDGKLASAVCVVGGDGAEGDLDINGVYLSNAAGPDGTRPRTYERITGEKSSPRHILLSKVAQRWSIVEGKCLLAYAEANKQPGRPQPFAVTGAWHAGPPGKPDAFTAIPGLCCISLQDEAGVAAALKASRKEQAAPAPATASSGAAATAPAATSLATAALSAAAPAGKQRKTNGATEGAQPAHPAAKGATPAASAAASALGRKERRAALAALVPKRGLLSGKMLGNAGLRCGCCFELKGYCRAVAAAARRDQPPEDLEAPAPKRPRAAAGSSPVRSMGGSVSGAEASAPMAAADASAATSLQVNDAGDTGPASAASPGGQAIVGESAAAAAA
eukprot:TRINITY_DN100645_c0_g1_i1.p1 TRINITY_DN100645_c0_g1~~TRINITY_DN100645_c0_g1_i1.p1  ORF type:complete len:707 (-),score=158.67 TRINITY_DN100645_c0_g1_i1:65-2185(-)